ncbi:MAG: cysteine methyltransferase [Chloroflexi bacterium]|nr:MAG: cysteine methyltransferase [Chloroflexota bacterium]
MDAWTRTVREVVRRIPRGRVASYGLVAVVAGRPRAARAVGNVMRACRDRAVPAHRVVRADGSPAFARFRPLLEAEGVPFRRGRVDMRSALWAPPLSGARSRVADRARRGDRHR